LAGRVHLPVVFRSRSGLQRKVWATLEIEALTPVVVTRRMVARSAVITADDVRLIERDAAETPKDAVSRLEDAIGMRAKRLMQAQSVVTSGLIARPTLIKRGDVVRIIAKTDGLQITALGEARKKGSRGDRIQVVNLGSKKVLQARVIDARTVQVDF
jgi:flagella basal body P-ring formation protein FlgA